MCLLILQVLLLWCTCIKFCAPMYLISALFSLRLFELFTHSNWHVFPFYLSILNTGKLLDGKSNAYAFALVESVRRFSEERLLGVKLYLAGEFSHFNTDNVQPCTRLLNMCSHICKTGRELYFVKVTCCILYYILANGMKYYICNLLEFIKEKHLT